MSADQFAQSDLNRMQTLAMRDNLESLNNLLEKLYKRNPSQWRKGGFSSMDEAIELGRQRIGKAQVPADLAGLNDIEILSVALDPQYGGDRVAALVQGLANMILAAHGFVDRFYLGDSVDAQYVFNAARNVEIAAWLLASRRDAQGQLLLLSNEITPQVSNLSFAREFAAIAARLDLEAEMLDENLRRIGINYVQSLLFFRFLPVR